MPFENALRGLASTLARRPSRAGAPLALVALPRLQRPPRRPFQRRRLRGDAPVPLHPARARRTTSASSAAPSTSAPRTRTPASTSSSASRASTTCPISRAIQASLSINPAFGSTKIGERYYVDGAVTRTSNFTEAIRKGADLILVLDPLAPYVSKGVAGFASRRGLLYNADQDIRTASYTRFETARHWVTAAAPRRQPLRLPPGEPAPEGPVRQPDGPPPLPRHLARRLPLDAPADPPPAPPDVRRPRDPRPRPRHGEGGGRGGPPRGHAVDATFADFFPDGKVDVVRGMKPGRALRLAGRPPDEEVVCRAGERRTAVA